MKGYVFFAAVVLSLAGHILFFGIFRSDIKPAVQRITPGIFIITEEQMDYLMGIQKTVKDIIITPLPKSLARKNNMWADTVTILNNTVIEGVQPKFVPDSEFLSNKKTYQFSEVSFFIRPERYQPPDIIPRFTDLFYTGSSEGSGGQFGEQVFVTDNGLKLNYYIQGPVQARGLLEMGAPGGADIGFDGGMVKAKLRFWVGKDGRVNQIIVEEGSAFPIIDKKIISLVKAWRFGPGYDPHIPRYQWGVINIKLTK